MADFRSDRADGLRKTMLVAKRIQEGVYMYTLEYRYDMYIRTIELPFLHDNNHLGDTITLYFEGLR